MTVVEVLHEWQVTGNTSATLAAAIAANDYLQFTFTTQPGAAGNGVATDWTTWRQGGNAYPYATGDIGIRINGTVVHDGALPSTLPNAYLSTPFNVDPTYQLSPATTYTVRVYLYGGASGTFDSFGLNFAQPSANYATTFTEGGAAVAIAAPIAPIADADNTTQQSASVVLTNALAGDVLTVGALPSDITASVDTSVAGKITVSLSGNATDAEYAAAIQAITFSNTSANPSAADRTINVTTNDGILSSNTAVSTIHVVPVDTAPVETVPAALSTGNLATTITGLSVSDVDANGGTETVILSAGHGTLTLGATTGLTGLTGNGSGTVTFTGTLANINADIAALKYAPTAGYSGVDTVTFTTNDRGNTGSLPVGVTALSDTETVAVTVFAPPSLANDIFGTPINTPVVVPVLDNDSDANGFDLTVTKIGATAITAGGAGVAVTGGIVTLDVSGDLTFTPNAGYTGTPSFSYSVDDGHGSTATATVTGAVWAPPVALANSFATTTDLPITFNVVGNDSDVNGFPLAVTQVAGQSIVAGDPGVAVTGGIVTLGADGNLTFTPDSGYNGSPTFDYTIADGHGGNATATVTGIVSALNHPPVNVVPGDQSVTGNTLVFSTANGNAVQVTDDASDSAIIQTTVAVDKGSLTLHQTTGLTFVTGDGTADATITIKGTKAQINAALDGMTYTSPGGTAAAAQLTITTNDLGQPSGEDIPNGSFDTTLVVVGAGQQTITDQSNVPGWTTTATDHMIEIWGTGFSGVPAYEGLHFAELNANQVAADYNTTQIPQGQPLDFSFAHRGRAGIDTMNVTVIDAGKDGVFGTADDTTLLNKNFSDGNGAWGVYDENLGASTGDPIRLIFTSVSSAGGSNSVGNFLDAVHLGTTHLTDTDTVAIALNHPPVAQNDTVSVNEDGSVTIPVRANDIDPDSDPLTVVSVSQGAHGTVSIDPVSGNPIYTPSVNYYGADQFTYTISDGRGGTSTATVSLTINSVNDAPAGADKTIMTAEDTPVTLAAADFGFTDV